MSYISEISSGSCRVPRTCRPEAFTSSTARDTVAGSVVPRRSDPVPRGPAPSASTNCRLLFDDVMPGISTLPSMSSSAIPGGASGACPEDAHVLSE